MRHLEKIILHCTATPGNERGDVNVETVRRWHVKGNGWADIGYHFLVRRDGTVERGRPLDIPGAHTRGHNAESIGIAFSGGLNALTGEPEDTRTPEQRKSLHGLLNALILVFPSIESVHGHREFSNKACPCFDARAEYRHLTHGQEPEPGA